jgi:Lipocalin-like domain
MLVASSAGYAFKGVVALLQDLLAGTFHLVSLEARRSDGEVGHPLGRNPIGMFIFDRAGNFAVQLMNPDVTDGVATAFTGMFGTYVVDEERQTFTATPVGASHPSLIGVEILRHVRTADGLAVFNTPTQTTEGIESTTYITWQKVSSP